MNEYVIYRGERIKAIKNGNLIYLIKEIETKRNIRPNAKRKANEVLIIGMREDKFDKRLKEGKIIYE